MSERGKETILAGIVTNWSQVNDPVRFVARYAPAIRNYLHALIRNPHDADDAAQEFLTRIGERGFDDLTLQQGKRFRDYLIAAVRNAARSHLKQVGRRQQHEEYSFADPIAEETSSEAEAQWIAEWRKCALDRSMGALLRRERSSEGNLAHSVLKLRMEHPEERDAELAEKLSQKVGRTIKPEAFRKQLSRARRLLAELLVLEVAETLSTVNPEEVEEELIATGLMEFVRPFLPDDWREHGVLSDPEE